MMDPVNMHMSGTVVIVVIVLLIVLVALLLAVRIVGARIQASEESGDDGPLDRRHPGS